MKKFWIVLVIVMLVFGGGLFAVWRFVRDLDMAPDVSGGLLVWHVDESYAEQRDDTFLAQARHGRRPVMRDLLFALDRAARDPRIEGLLLDIRRLPVDWAKVEELADAVRRFRDSGKPVRAYLEYAGNKEYALAVAADEVILAPEAGMMVLGVTAQLSFMKDTLDKIGVRADFVHVGKYKSAPEALTRSESSDANREMMEAIVEDRYQRLVATIAAGRNVPPGQVRAWIDVGLYDAPTALAAGMVDTVLTLEEIEEQHRADAGVTDLDDYLLSRERGRAAGRVALIYAVGTIMPGDSQLDGWQGPVVGSDTVVEELRDALEDAAVDAVVLRVDSPGGSALASDVIWQEIQRVRRRKPVVVSMSGYAASGGYYISCAADSIFAEPGTLTGSIGVFAGKADLSGLYAKLGVHREFITRGRNALLFHDASVFTPEQRARFQELLEDFYERFVAKVAAGRPGLDAEAVHVIAQGRVWTGGQAVANGLVDDIGGLPRALDAVKRMIGLDPADRVAVTVRERKLGLLERVLLRMLEEGAAGAMPTTPLDGAVAELARDGTLSAVALLDGQPLALLPLRLQFP
jgi:protease-4